MGDPRRLGNAHRGRPASKRSQKGMPTGALLSSRGPAADTKAGFEYAKEAATVRSLVGIITTIATVIHFTFGCCLHPCHLGGRGECVTRVTEAAACEGCCHDHAGAAGDHGAEPSVRVEGSAESSVGAMVACDGCLGCDGCHCAATPTETGTTFASSPPSAFLVSAFDEGAAVPFAVASGMQPPDPNAHPCPGRHALFERFLI